MENQSKQHVQVPDQTKESKLKPFDKLVYANLRRYMNKDTYESFPAIGTIAKLCNCSEPTVRNAIKRLIEAKEIQVTSKMGRSNIYKFNKFSKNFEMFTPDFLDNKTMTADEKAYYIGFQSQSFKEDGFAVSSLTNEEIASNLNITTKTVKKYNQSLQDKGIMIEFKSKILDAAGYNKPVRAVDLTQVCQAVLYVNERVDQHEDRITIMEKKIDMLMAENKQLRKERDSVNAEIINEFEFE